VTLLSVGLSTCPNDTFLFAPMLDGRLQTPGLDLRFELADVQELNESLTAGRLDVSKASFATALELAEGYGVLPVGSALGFGVGPVLLARAETADAPFDSKLRVLCPGPGTTATLLMRCLHPEATQLVQCRFDEIMPALRAGRAEAGVCIHEGRFTYQAQGLVLREDLGRSWERWTGHPVPLGGLLCRRDLPVDTRRRLTDALRRSLEISRADPAASLPTMRRHAQELSDEVIWQHVELYVNDHTSDLGVVGQACLEELARRAGSPGGLVAFD
jgi:1,4-dihydroxy-6-naphthoate synthase